MEVAQHTHPSSSTYALCPTTAKMPSKTNPGDSMSREDSNAFLNDYLADWDGDDPFRSPSPEPGQNTKPNEPKNNKNDKKRKTDVLGIDEELDVAKKARAPRVKLDEARLLSDKGIPKLRKTAPRLKLKGKGHEVKPPFPTTGYARSLTGASSSPMRHGYCRSTKNGSTIYSRRLPSLMPWP